MQSGNKTKKLLKMPTIFLIDLREKKMMNAPRLERILFYLVFVECLFVSCVFFFIFVRFSSIFFITSTDVTMQTIDSTYNN